jgi:hypothetical protein
MAPMMSDAVGIPPDGLVGRGDSDLAFDLSDQQHAAIKEQLSPDEYIVWAGRGIPRPLPSIPVFPAFFAAVLCGVSGFALMVLFGIHGLEKLPLGETLFLLCLAPGALGCITAIGIAWSWRSHRYVQRRVSRSFYILTDRRAIVGLEGREGEVVALDSWTGSMFDGTLGMEYGDGIGAVYFLRDGKVVQPEWGFDGIDEVRRVEGLIREILLGEKLPPGWDLGEL